MTFDSPRSIITHSCPDIGEQEIEAMAACMRSLQLIGGQQVQELETMVARDLGYQGAIATTTGAHAIHLALCAHWRRRPAHVGLPSYLCRSVYDAILMAGCQPHLLDIDFDTLSLDVNQAMQAGMQTIIVPHMFGIRAPIEAFMATGVFVIEDCAQRLAPLGAGQTEPRPQVRMLSMEATKLFTCGHGGLLLAHDANLLADARHLRDGSYKTAEAAFELPLTDLQAAMAMVQWRRLSTFLTRRRELAAFYLDTLGRDFPDRIHPAMWAADTYHFRFLLVVEDPATFAQRTAELGILCRRPIAPVPLHMLFGGDGSFPTTDKAFASLISLPIYPKLTDAEAEQVVKVVGKVLGEG